MDITYQGNFDSYDIHLNLSPEENRAKKLSPPKAELAEFAKDKPIKKEGLTTGQPYVLVRNANNDLIPVRIFSKPVKSIVRLRDKLLNTIREFKKSEAAEIVKFNVVNKKGVKKSVPDFDNNLANLYSGVKVILRDGQILFKSQRGKANFANQKDTNDVEYAKRGLTAGAILVDTNTNTNYQLTEKVNGKWQVQQLDAEFNKIGEPTNAEFLNDLMVQGNIELHYAYNYYRFYDMDNKPLQIDHKKVNIGNYNETIANERLESDLVPKNNFASPKFQVDLASLFKKEPKQKRVATKVEPTKKGTTEQTPDIEAKKADIERRRQEELKENAYRIKDSKISKTGVDEYGDTIKTIVETNKDGSHVVYYEITNKETGETARTPRDKFPKENKAEDLLNKLSEEGGTVKKEEIPQSKVVDKIKAKYDAELAALEQTKTPTPSTTPSQGIKVEQFTITEKEGKYFYANGEEVTDQTTINKYLVRKNYDANRKVSYSGTDYYVLPDNRIISLGKTTKGKERYKSGKTKEKILAKVKDTAAPVQQSLLLKEPY